VVGWDQQRRVAVESSWNVQSYQLGHLSGADLSLHLLTRVSTY